MTDDAADLAFQISRLLDMGRTADARRLLGQLLKTDPRAPETLYLAARVEHDEGRAAEALARVREALARAPDHRGARLLLFDLDFEADRFAEAESNILGLLRAAPEDAFLLAVYARLMLRVYQLEKARALVNEALRRAPELPLAQILDALLHIIHDDDTQASARLGQLMAQDPEAIHVAWTAMAVLQAQQRPREVLEIGRQLLRATPNNTALIDVLVEARLQSHWLMKPLWPFQRFGWGGSIAVWLVGAIGLRLLARTKAVSEPVLGLIAVLYVLYIAYSWIGPPLLRRWLRRRGF